jgi:hypothetical protein
MSNMQSQKAWSDCVNAIMKKDYAITLEDAGLSEDDIRDQFRWEPEPAEFVRWYATKYDLDHVSAWGLGVSQNSRLPAVSKRVMAPAR